MNKEEHIENIAPTGITHVIYSGAYIPTLDNFPASNWRRKNKLENHEGEIFVKQSKYMYVFTKKEDGSFCWEPIKQQGNMDKFISAMAKKRKKRYPGGWK